MTGPARRVLIGSAGTGTAFGAVCALRRVWSQSVGIFTMDINPPHLVTASLLSDAFFQVPPFVSPEFPERLLGIITRQGVDTYLPLFPQEIVIAARLKGEGRIGPGVEVLAPPAALSELCADKLELSRMLPSHGVPMPETVQAAELPDGTELFLKPRHGVGSRGARKVVAGRLPECLAQEPDEWIVQEVCQGPEVTVDSFYDPATGYLRAICRERIEVKSGVSTKSRLFEDGALTGYARAVADLLGLRGSFCFQVMKRGRDWVLTDLNPRPGAATAMCAVTGNDFFAAAFAHWWGEPVERFFTPLEGEVFVTRQYAEFAMAPHP